MPDTIYRHLIETACALLLLALLLAPVYLIPFIYHLAAGA